MRSIRGRLLRWLTLVSFLAVTVAAMLAFHIAQGQTNELFDYHLRQMALTLLDQPFEDAEIEGTLQEEAEYDFVIQVWTGSRNKLYSSHQQPSLPPLSGPGFSTVARGGQTWRVYALVLEDLNIQVSQPVAVRQRYAARAAFATVAPVLVLLPVMGLLIWLTVRRGLLPLDALATDLKQRDHTSLAPLPDRDLPAELQPMVGELNDLLLRLGRAMEAQRAFTADAAHELRTPLTALQLQVQLAERAQDADGRAEAFAQVRAGLRRCIHLVNQLLTLARTEAAPPAVDQPVDLPALARAVVLEHAGIAQHRGVDLGVARADAVSVLGSRDALHVLLGNLVQNAVRYTPSGGKVDVDVIGADDGPVLQVTDTGPGIPRTEWERVFDRFHRGPNIDPETLGSGIGLAIVRQVAARHGAEVSLHTPEGGAGLMVRVRFPTVVARSD